MARLNALKKSAAFLFVKPIASVARGQHATDRCEEKQGEGSEAVYGSKKEGRARHLVDQPADGDLLHPLGRAGEQRAEPEQAVVAILQAAEGTAALFLDCGLDPGRVRRIGDGQRCPVSGSGLRHRCLISQLTFTERFEGQDNRNPVSASKG